MALIDHRLRLSASLVRRLSDTTRSELCGAPAATAAHCTHAAGYLNSSGGSTSAVR
ncbi:hypothetical protein ACIGBL_04090 [Streptomyces sp. NPDC085614]|uniref:hypothetical protein n=1 Tax=Streptomyces sp. NPDC085614 TaxID=3365733 RepID=UPI0037CDB6B5